MNQKADKDLQVSDNLVVSMEYKMSIDGEVVEQTLPDEAVQFIQGIGQLIPGLEREIYGLRVGDGKEIHVLPKDGYGEYDADEDAYAEIPVDQFPEDMPVEEGVEVVLQDDAGDEQEAYITAVDDENQIVHLSLNHPLAGQELDFSIKIVGLREASQEELDHQHVHHNE